MSKIFKPRRGKASTMAGSKKTTVLAAGEFFMEVPDTGVGTGKAKIKMGDGATQYSSLPYALGDTSNDKIDLVSNSATTVAAALNSMVNGNTLGTQLGAAKQACTLLNNGVTKLNEDLPFKFGIDDDGNYGYYKAGADTVTPFKTGGDIKTLDFEIISNNLTSSSASIYINTKLASTQIDSTLVAKSAISSYKGNDYFTISYASNSWTVTLKKDCYVDNELKSSGATITWKYNVSVNHIISDSFIPQYTDPSDYSVIYRIPNNSVPKFEQTFLTESSAGKSIVGNFTIGTAQLTAQVTCTATASGTASGYMQVTSKDYYDLTNWSTLLVAAVQQGVEHTGHAIYIKLINEAGEETTLKTYTAGSGNTDARNDNIDISSYSGKYKIMLDIRCGHATYGYAASFLRYCLYFMGLC